MSIVVLSKGAPTNLSEPTDKPDLGKSFGFAENENVSVALTVPFSDKTAGLIIHPNVTDFNPAAFRVEGVADFVFHIDSAKSHAVVSDGKSVTITLLAVDGKSPHCQYTFEII